jgi:hypothetical protein
MADSAWSYGPPQVAPVAPVAPTPVPFLDCDNCGETIEEGDECVEIYIGRAGRSRKTGQPTVVESSTIEPQHATAKLHLWCVSEYAVVVIYEDQFPEEPRFCTACDAQLDGDGKD